MSTLKTLSTPLFALAILLPGFATAAPSAGNYRTPDGAIYYYNGEGRACRWKDLGTWERYSNHEDIIEVPYDDLKKAKIDGYCEGIGSDPLPTRIPSDREATEAGMRAGAAKPNDNRPALRPAGKYCRYFVATHRFTPLTHNGEFSNLTLWIMDENRHSGLSDAWNWEDTLRVGRGLKSNERQVHRPISTVSNWFELQPQDQLPPEFSFYGFSRWKSYFRSQFEVTRLNPLTFKDWTETRVVADFPGTQDIVAHVAHTSSYALDYRVLRLCAERQDTLYPEPELVIPPRVPAPAPKK